MSSKSQYPKDFNPPNQGTCDICGCVTKAYDPRWLARCPLHWQELLKR